MTGSYDPTQPLQNSNLGSPGVPEVLSLNVAAAGTTNGVQQDNPVGRGVVLFIDITTLTGTTPTVTVNLQLLDVVSGNWVTVASSAALNATGESTLTVYPGIAATANVAINGVIGRTWRAQAVVGGTPTSVVATIAATVIL